MRLGFDVTSLLDPEIAAAEYFWDRLVSGASIVLELMFKNGIGCLVAPSIFYFVVRDRPDDGMAKESSSDPFPLGAPDVSDRCHSPSRYRPSSIS